MYTSLRGEGETISNKPIYVIYAIIWAGLSPVMAQIKVIGPRLILIDRATNSGQATLELYNSGGAHADLDLISGELKNKQNNATLQAALLLSPNASAPGGSKLTVGIDSKQVSPLVIAIKNVVELGEWDATLEANGASLATVTVRSVPFNVKISLPAPDHPEVHVSPHLDVNIPVRNDSPLPYPTHWRLTFANRVIMIPGVYLPAAGNAELHFVPPNDWFPSSYSPASIEPLLKGDKNEGHLSVFYDGVASTSSPAVDFPVTIDLDHFSQGWRDLGSYILIFGVLLAGGLSSLILSFLLPNLRQRLDRKEELKALFARTQALSERIGSKLRVMVRVERRSLSELLKSRSVFMPDFGGVAAKCATGIKNLNARVDLLVALDRVLAKLNRQREKGVAPSRVGEVERMIEDVAVLLEIPCLTDAQGQTAEKIIQTADALVEKLDQSDEEFGKNLAARVIALQKAVAAVNTTATFKRLDLSALGCYKAVFSVSSGTLTIPPEQYSWFDQHAVKLGLAKDYVVFCEGITGDLQKAVQSHEDELMKLIQLDGRLAKLLFEQMNQNKYAKDVEDAILLGKEAVKIEMDPAIPRPDQPVDFLVRFLDDALDDAKARKEITPTWDFDHDGLTEEGAYVSHYFSSPARKAWRFSRIKAWFKGAGHWFAKSFGSGDESPPARAPDFTVSVAFRRADGTEIKGANQAGTITKAVFVVPDRNLNRWARAITELVMLLGALLIAVFGLVAGARDQLLKLDLLPGLFTVFLIGFGADRIKNLIAQRQPPPA